MREELLRIKRTTIVSLLFVFWSFMALGEGTKEVMPASTDTYYLLFNRTGGLNVPFGLYTPNTVVYQTGTTGVDYRFNVAVCNVNERIRFGFKSNNGNTFFRVKRTSDNAIVFGPMLIPNAANSEGSINSYAQAVAGPRSIVGPATGYNDTGFVVTPAEIAAGAAQGYYFEFNNGNNSVYTANQFTMQYFDVTVASPANVAIPGRIWSKAWHFADGGSSYKGSFFIYADDGIVTKLSSTNFFPYWFSISCNATGVSNTGNPNIDSKSIAGAKLYPQYRIFFNDPDNSCFPTGAFGSLVGVPTITGCGTNRCINMQVDRAGRLLFLLDLNGVPGYQAGTSDRRISHFASVGMNCIPWDGLDGLGSNIPTNQIIKVQVDFLNGITHFPLYDAEENTNGFMVTSVRPLGPVPKLFWDDSNIIPSSYAAGTALDGITDLTGCVTGTGCHRWRSRGSNNCPPCSETINTYWYAKIDTVSIFYQNTNVFVDANTTTPGTGFTFNNRNVCRLKNPIQLNGSVTGPAVVTGFWTSTGTGTFLPNNTALNATYTPSTLDSTNGSFIIKLNSTGGLCPPVLDSMLITLIDPPSVKIANPIYTVCKNNNIVSFAVDATKNAAATSVRWTGGTGTYTPNVTTLGITYRPSAAELTANTVLLTLTGTGNAACAPSVATTRINYTPSPTASAGAAKTVCANPPAIPLNTITGVVTAGNTPAWTSSSGCVACFTSTSTAATVYNPSAADKAAGSVVLTLTSSLAGCTNVTSNMTLTIRRAPTPVAGPAQALCQNNTRTATLTGTTAFATSSSWSSSSGCGAPACFSSLTSLTPTYRLSNADTAAGGVTLTLTSISAGCLNSTSTVRIDYLRSPRVTVPSSINYCKDNPQVPLTGAVSGGPAGIGGIWTSLTGAGTFFPDNQNLNAIYQLDPTEISTGIVAVRLTSTNNGTCLPNFANIILNESQVPTVNAGANLTVCRNNAATAILGTITGAFTNPRWSSATSGAAGFGNANSLSTNYTLNATDLANGSVLLTLRGNSLDINCAPSMDTMTIFVTEPPTVNAGSDLTGICFSPGTINLTGFSSTGSGTWSGGAGSFTATSANGLNTTYNSTAAERAGPVRLILTSTNNGNCNLVRDTVFLNFAPQITVSVGASPTITTCSNKPDATLSGSSPITGSGIWSGGAGTFTPSENDLNAVYTPTAGEITTGSVVLTLTATNTGGCSSIPANLTINIPAAPTLQINAGAATINKCADNLPTALSVVLPAGLGVIWTGGAGTFTPDNTSAATSYTPTPAEVSTGSLTLTATTTGNTTCNALTDQIDITIAPVPTINAGADQVLCGSTPSVMLTGVVTDAAGGTWTSSGTGIFGSTTAANTTYTPSAADKTSGLVTITYTSTGSLVCAAVNDNLTISFTVVPTINAGPDVIVCANTLPAQLAGSGTPATWSGGAGTFTPNNTSMTATYTPTLGEITAGSVTLTLTTNASGACPQINDQMDITIQAAPIATAGSNVSICGNQASINLVGSVNAQATGGFWTTSGSGSFGDATLLSTTYSPSVADKTAGSVFLILTTTGIGNCAAHSDTLILTISPTVTVFAGPDQTLCQDNSILNLAGVVTGATGGTWTIITGAGTLSNPTLPNGASYTPAIGETTISLRLTTTGNPAPCVALTDDVDITLTPGPAVTASVLSPTVCGDVPFIALIGTVSNASGQTWTTNGTGTISLSNSTVNTTYIPSLNETGLISFTITSSGSGVCADATATTTVNITPKPTVNAGLDISRCSNNALTVLTGTVTVATGGLWSTLGDGTFSAVSGNGLTATYTPGPLDFTNGTVNLRLTTTGVGTCTPISDMMVLTLTSTPTINGGPDRTVCANNSNIALAGVATVATGGTWTTLGTGVFSAISANGLNATYTPGNPDTTAHAVKLVLTSTGNGTCTPVTDTVDVIITPRPIVTAGADQVICEDSFFVKLNADFLHATAGIWSTTGTGSFFNSNATFDTAVYVPSPADRALGSVILTFTTTVHGACSPVFDSQNLTITKAPTVSTGIDQKICSDASNITVNWNRNTIPTGIRWTTSGNGTFAATTSAIASSTTTYTPSALDKSAGSVVLTVTTTGIGTCRPVFEQMILNIVPKPVVNAGFDLTACNDIYNTGVLLNPTVSFDSIVTWNSPSFGTFGATDNVKNATYFPSIADTISKTINLTLTANGFSPCGTTTDTIRITFKAIPIINAGSDFEVCNGTNGNLNGLVLNAAGGVWTTSGTGTFAPDQNTLNATYIPSVADTVAGTVTLTLSSTGAGTCNQVSDQVVITFRQRPTVNAGADNTICADAGSFTIIGSGTNATSATWTSSSGGSFFPTTGFNTMYFPNSNDSINGQVTLTMVSSGSGTCAPASDNLVLTITPIPSIDAGPNIDVCKTALTTTLNASVVNATGAFWSSFGDGTFDDPDLLNPTYTFGPADLAVAAAEGSILFSVISQGNGNCRFYTDTVRVRFTPTTNISAGADRTICRQDFPIQLAGNGTTGFWSGGTLAGYSNINALNSTYTPTALEDASGSVTLTLNAVSVCAGPPSNVTFTFINSPVVSVNPLTTICTNVNSINLTGVGVGGTWTTTGSGGAFGNSTAIPTTYTPSAADKTSGILKFTYTIPASGFCNAVFDTATIRINPTPIVSAGPDQTRCANSLTAVTMNGTFTVASGIQWYTVNGTGGALASPTSINAQYTPAAGDIPVSPIQVVIETTGASFCSVQRDTMLISITAAPTALIGADTTMCADKTAQLSAVTTVASGGIWTTTGTGTFSPNNSSKLVIYSPSVADTAAGSVIVNYMTTGNGICSAVNTFKTITLTEKPIVKAGLDDTICSGQINVLLNAAFVANAPSVLWTTTGTGFFTPSNTSLNAFYTPSSADKLNGGALIRLASTGIIECDSVFDVKNLMIIPSPIASVNAGFDQVICKDETSANLAGFIQIATAAKWDCQGAPCSGTFLPSDAELFTTYFPSAADTAAGSVILRLTTTDGNGICSPVFDEMLLTIIDIPLVEAGPAQTVCADTASIQLNGTVSHVSLLPVGYSWEASGTGFFAPNAFVANPVYVPNASDKSNGKVSFKLTSTNNGTCQPNFDTVRVTITEQPTINAGSDKATCANVVNFTVIGTMTVATGATWTSGGTGVIVPSGNGLTSTYAPSALDDSAGVVQLTITTTAGLGSCKPVNDKMLLTINPAPKVNAGVDRTVCSDNLSIAVLGTVQTATGGVWNTVGSGSFTSGTSLSTSYKPSAADTTAGTVNLVLTSTGNGLCLPEKDTVTLIIDPKPIVNPGLATVCEIQNGAALNGAIVNAGGGLWTSSGTGAFAINAGTLNATYFPSAADAIAGNITLTLTSTANGTCNAISKTTNLNITRIPIANAGPDQFVCQNTTTAINATADPLGLRYEWSRFSGAVINPNILALNVLADKDTAFILTVYDFKNCASVKDTVQIHTFQMPVLTITGTPCITDSNAINSIALPGLPPVPGIYQWYRNAGVMGGQNTAELHPNVNGTYLLTYSYGGCSATSNPFTMNISPIVAGIDKTNCVNNTTILGLSNVSGGTTFTYAWAADPTIIGATNGSSIAVSSNLTFDTIPYRVTVSNEFLCPTSDSVYLISIAKPLLSLANDTLCQNQVTLLDASASNFGVGNIPPIESFNPTYIWTRNGVNLNNNSKTQLATSNGRYIVEITIGDCNNNTDTSDVIYNQFAVFNLPDKAKFCSETDSILILNAKATPPAGFTLSYLWTPTNETTPVIAVAEEGYYKVTVTSTIGNNSCPISDSTYVRNLCAPRVFVPNVFTPDKDGDNKYFKIFGNNYKNFSITVFNRWGEVIFASDQLEFMKTTGWDGMYKDKPMPEGVYTYIIYYDGESEEFSGPFKKEGEILILR